MIQKIEIDNRKSSAVNGKWDPDKSKLIKEIQNASTPKKLMNEMFLSHPDEVDDMHIGNVKYPHHVISDGKCVLSISGVKAAYSRLKQQDEYNGEMKKHIDRHRKELGMDVEEAELESLQNDLESTFESLQKAIQMAESRENQATNNMFDLMLEKPTINPSPTGTPIAQDPIQNAAQPADLNTQPVDPNTGTNPVNQPSQIPVANVDPTEDTSTNNPVEGPDDRDQNNLDGNARKEMYQNFANVMIQANKSCVFGTIFDQDIFKSEYKIVPYEMRYFYRLQNPVSVEVGELRFIPFGTELLEAQDKYDLGKKMFVFATNNDKPIFFNQLDKTIWFNDDKLNDTFDGFIEQLIQSNGELQIPEDGQPQNQEADVQYQQNPADATVPTDQMNPGNPGEQPVDQNAQDGMAPVDLDQVGGTPTATTGLGDQSQTVQPGEPAPVDLSAQNASYDPENDSIIDMMDASVLTESNDFFQNLSESAVMEPVDLNDDLFLEEVIDLMEASHSTLNFDYRKAYDYDTGHAIKIVYSLDNIKVHDIGDGYLKNHPDENREDIVREIQKNIRKKGNMDHLSSGQKVLKIIDRVTNKQLDKCRVLSPFAPGVPNSQLDIYDGREDWRSWFEKDPSRPKRYIKLIKVGDVDNDKSFKATKWFKNDTTTTNIELVNRKTGEKIQYPLKRENTVGRGTRAESLKYGRGAKMDDMEVGTSSSIVGSKPKYEHPSKKDLKRDPELYIMNDPKNRKAIKDVSDSIQKNMKIDIKKLKNDLMSKKNKYDSGRPLYVLNEIIDHLDRLSRNLSYDNDNLIDFSAEPKGHILKKETMYAIKAEHTKMVAGIRTWCDEHPDDKIDINIVDIDKALDEFTESIDIDISIIDMMSEGTAFPNDALIDRNKKLAEEREKRKYGIPMFE